MKTPRRPWLPAAAVLAAGALAASLAGAWQRDSNRRTMAARMDALAVQATARLQVRIARYEYGLRGLRGAVVASGLRGIRRAQFEDYSRTRDIATEFRGARGFGVVWRVPRADEARFVSESRADGASDFAIHEFAPHDGERAVIRYIDPVRDNEAAVGLDIASEPRRREAAQAAMREGRAALTAPVTIVQAAGKASQSFLLLLPIYRPHLPTDTPALREAACAGWSYAALVTDEMIEGLEGLDTEFGVALADSRGGDGHPFHVSARMPALQSDAALPRHEASLPVFGREWRLTLAATPEFVLRQRLASPAAVAAAIMGVACMLSLLAYLVGRSARREIAAGLERARLAAIVAGSRDAIVGTTPDGTVTDWNDGARRLLGFEAWQAVGRRLESLLLPAERQGEEQALREAVLAGAVAPAVDTTRLRADGSPVEVSVTLSPIVDGHGALVGLACTLRDIGEVRRAQRQLVELNDGLEREVADRTRRLNAALLDLRSIIDSLPSIIGFWDRDLVNGMANKAYSAWFGVEPESLKGRRLPDLLGPELFALNRRHVEAVLAGVPQTFERDIARPDGLGTRHSLTHYLPKVVDGAVQGFYVLVHDVTELTQQRLAVERLQADAERARKEAEEHRRFLQDMTDRLPLRVSYLDRQQRHRFANTRACAALGLAAGQIMGRSRQELAGRGGPGPVEAGVERALRGEGSRFEVDEAGASGEETFEYQVVPDGDRGVFVLASDITRRKSDERELARALTLLRSVLDAATEVSIIAADPQGVVTLFNRGAENLLGYAAGEAIGRLRAVDFHLRAELEEVAQETGRLTGESLDGDRILQHPLVLGTPREWRLRRKDGQTLPVSLVTTRIHDAGGAPAGFLGIASDIRERQAAEAALHEAVGQALRANAAKSRFLANMSHEIRTPMNAIVGLTYLLGQRSPGGEAARLVGELGVASRTLLDLINDILDISKIEAGEMSLELAPFALRDVLSDLAAILRAQAQTRGIGFALSCAPEVPDALLGDAVRLRQVLLNLLSNAIKFTGSGRVGLCVRAACAQAGWADLEFEVEDTGMGIPEDAMSRLFRPFSQLDESTTRRFGGTGLGLAIVSELTSLMGGSLEVQSRVGAGTTFKVSVRFARPQGDQPLPAARKGVATLGRHCLEGLRLLVVDDSTVNLDVAGHILALEGAQVATAADGRQALDLLRQTPDGVDLVLMDLQMPEMDGHEAIARIRGELGLSALPVVALTAGNSASERERALAAGAAAVLGKPFDPAMLVQAILRWAAPERSWTPPGPAKAADEAWPEIAGVDAAQARLRLGGDRALFCRLLTRVVEDFPRDDRAAGEDDAQALARWMHRLQGSAGTLGLAGAGRLAAEVEQACKRGDLEQAGRLRAALRAAFQDLREAASGACGPHPQGPDGAAPPASLPEELPALLAQLLAQDLRALERFERLAQPLLARLGDGFEDVAELVRELRFEQAAARLEPLAAELDAPRIVRESP